MFVSILETIKNKKSIIFLLIGTILGIIFLVTDAQTPTIEKNSGEKEPYTNDYISTLEEKTEQMVNKINGISNAKVMITLKNSGEQVFASDDSETSKKHVIVDNGLVCIDELMPEIEGVAVVCNGGNAAVNKQKITELLCALLGINSTHIYITE